MICLLDACKVCTGCAHGHADQCRGEVRCPTTGEVSPCRYAPARTCNACGERLLGRCDRTRSGKHLSGASTPSSIDAPA